MGRAVVVFAVVLLALASVGRAAGKPNIVYLLVDDMGFADCGFNGGKDIRTPNIDALSRQGSVFQSYYVQPLCSASRAALLGGRFPIHNGIYGALKTDSKFGMPLDERTLAQAMQGQGYTTAIVGKWHLGMFEPAYLPTRRGFEHQYGLWYGQIDYFTHKRAGRVDWHRDDKPLDEPGYSTNLIANEAVRLINAQPAGKPLFLYVPFNAVHGPFQVPAAYKVPYADLPRPRQTLAGMLAVADEAVGQIVRALDDRHLRDDTLIIFSSDNGGVQPGRVTMNTPLRAGKGTIYEGGVRVPAFAVWPGKIPVGKTIRAPVHIVDWYPTLLGLTGAPADQTPHLDGVDIWPLLTTGVPPARDALFLGGTSPRTAALRMGDYKLLMNPGPNERAGPPTFELYNVAADISETKDLSAADPDRVKRMRERLEPLLQNAAKPLGNANPEED